MDIHTWRVDVTLSDDGFDVIAKARFADCPVDLVGVGAAPLESGSGPQLVTQAVAAQRALESLAIALGRLTHAEAGVATEQD